jgi:hypothetical protein
MTISELTRSCQQPTTRKAVHRCLSASAFSGLAAPSEHVRVNNIVVETSERTSSYTDLMAFTHALTVLASLSLVACASNPPVQPVTGSKSQFDGAVYSGEVSVIDRPTLGVEAYRAFYQGGSGFVSVSSVRETVEDMDDKHCARKGQAVRPLQETTSKPPHILGNFPRLEIVFECVPATLLTAGGTPGADKLGQIERLKKLLDSGALSQQEFDREKAKMLGTQ